MANISKNQHLDTRSFPEIWKELTKLQQLELRNELVEKLHVARQTVHNWANGKAKPIYDTAKIQVSKSLASVTGIKTHYLTLFL